MAHNIDSMMYAGEKPWHGLGTRLENAATAAEAITAAGLDWRVSKEPLYLLGGKPVPGAFATVRENNKAPLGVVGRIYRPLQNKEAFSFFDAVVDAKEAIYHTAGALGNGSRVWILAKLPGCVRVVGEDVAEKFLLLTNTHDGSAPVEIMFTPIRVVCQNTLNIGMMHGERKQKLRHTSGLGLRVRDVREGLGIMQRQFAAFEEAAQALTKVQLDGQAWRGYCRAAGLIAADESAKLTARARAVLDEATRLFESGKGNNLPGVRGTAWAAFNAVTEYVDHVRMPRDRQNELEARAKSLLFGGGAELKRQAWEAALALA